MSLTQYWDEYELYFHHEFINDAEFSESKKEILQVDGETYFISRDFTIYQEKTKPTNQINEIDFRKNYGTFVRILHHLPFAKVTDFLEFHFKKFSGKKTDFLNFVYREFKGSKTTQGGKEIPPSQQKLMLLEWCELKLNEQNPNRKFNAIKSNRSFIHNSRIVALRKINSDKFDLTRLIRMLDELNDNYAMGNFLSVAMISRSIINHIPPIFGHTAFDQVCAQYGGVSFKKNMTHLNKSMKSIAEMYLHEKIRESESLPNENQVDFSRELDVLIAEITRFFN
ncbi:hypothetical protein [Aureibaculum conchae]|uniref:hypothetical protein n=1 Tax=Aureibaculum sp. 2308TA14-22 TaxID=3108392 RepID=UPI003398029B